MLSCGEGFANRRKGYSGYARQGTRIVRGCKEYITYKYISAMLPKAASLFRRVRGSRNATASC